MKQHHHPDVKEIDLIGVLAALGDPVRLRIVSTLIAEGEKGSTEFACGIANSTLSHHRKEGTRCFVALRPEIEERFPGLLQSVLRFAG
jgi:DNA-binding transcriptional ArsR family regulator